MKKIFPLLFASTILLLTGCNKSIKKYTFHEEPVHLSKGTDGTVGKSGQYVLFGDYPQSIKSEKVNILEDFYIQKGAFICYEGSDGNYYVKIQEKGHNESNIYSNGKPVSKEKESFQYFKIEPIKWRIIATNYNNSNTTYLLCETMIDSGIPFYPLSTMRNLNNKEICTNNYKYSTMRFFLNGKAEKDDDQLEVHLAYIQEEKGFLQSAFTESAQNLIAITEVDNSPVQMSYDGINGLQEHFACENTFDKVFLPSTLELVQAGGFNFPLYNEGIIKLGNGSTGNPRIRKATDYALAKGAYQHVYSSYGGWWWTRSPYYQSHFDIRYISDNGIMTMTDYVYDLIDGVVPAICLPNEVF